MAAGRTLAAATLCAALLSGHALAQDGSVARSSLSVVVPLAVTPEEDLDFGRLHGTPIGGSVLIDAAGNVVDTNIQRLGDGNGDDRPNRGRFAIVGEPNRAYRVSLPTSLSASRLPPEGDAALTADNLGARMSNTESVGAIGHLDADGGDTVHVFGRLVVPPMSQAGRYAVQVPVTVSYD
jgi:Domain of unknown function (DUF4402)